MQVLHVICLSTAPPAHCLDPRACACLWHSPPLQAPEVLDGEKATAASDVYSLGMVRCCTYHGASMLCIEVSSRPGIAAMSADTCSTGTCPHALPLFQVLFELLTWRLPWSFADMSPFKVGANQLWRWALRIRQTGAFTWKPALACIQVGATIRRGGRPEVPPREALPGPNTAGWAGLDTYVQLMR